MKDTSQDPNIWLNDLYNLSLKSKYIKEKHKEYEYEMNPHIYDVLPEEKRSVRVSSNVNASNTTYKDL